MNIELIALISTVLPVFALSFCYLYPLLADYETINRTHCNARNFLPSVSAAISYSPQTSILWFFLILAHTPFRFKLAKCLNETYKKLFARIYTSEFLSTQSMEEYKNFLKFRKMMYISHLVNKIEIIGLLVLSTFTSMSNYGTTLI